MPRRKSSLPASMVKTPSRLHDGPIFFSVRDAVRLRLRRSPGHIDCSSRLLRLPPVSAFLEKLFPCRRTFCWRLISDGIRGLADDGFVCDPITGMYAYYYDFREPLSQVHVVAEEMGYGAVSFSIVEASDLRPNSPLGLAIRKALGMIQ